MSERRIDRNDYLYRTIGYKISAIRSEKRISQEFLASQCGLERTSIIHIEKGRQRVPIDRLYIIADALGVDVKDLLPDSNELNKIDPISRNRVKSETVIELNKILSDLSNKNKAEE